METCGDCANPWGPVEVAGTLRSHEDIRELWGHMGTVGTDRSHRGPHREL